MPYEPAERLIVALDFEPDPAHADVRSQALRFADSIEGTGVVVKVNSVLDYAGYGLITELSNRGLRVFVDKKWCDIPATMRLYGKLVNRHCPTIVTAMADAGVESLKALNEALPGTEVLAVLVLSHLTKADMERRYGDERAIVDALWYQSKIAQAGKVDGFICAPKDLSVLREAYGDTMRYVTPGIRDPAEPIKGDDQNPDRTATPAEAIRLGATRIVVGRPITQATDPRAAVDRFIEAIAQTA